MTNEQREMVKRLRRIELVLDGPTRIKIADALESLLSRPPEAKGDEDFDAPGAAAEYARLEGFDPAPEAKPTSDCVRELRPGGDTCSTHRGRFYCNAVRCEEAPAPEAKGCQYGLDARLGCLVHGGEYRGELEPCSAPSTPASKSENEEAARHMESEAGYWRLPDTPEIEDCSEEAAEQTARHYDLASRALRERAGRADAEHARGFRDGVLAERAGRPAASNNT